MVIPAYFGEKVYTMKPFTPPIETRCFGINNSKSGSGMIKISSRPER